MPQSCYLSPLALLLAGASWIKYRLVRHIQGYNKIVPVCTLSQDAVNNILLKMASAWFPTHGSTPLTCFVQYGGLIVEATTIRLPYWAECIRGGSPWFGD